MQNVCTSVNNNVLKLTHGLLGHTNKAATLSTFYPTVSGIIILSLKSIGQFEHV